MKQSQAKKRDNAMTNKILMGFSIKVWIRIGGIRMFSV